MNSIDKKETFFSHCEKNGISLLKDDVLFIRKSIKRIPFHMVSSVLHRYCDIWVECIEKGCLESEARRNSNLFLLDFSAHN